MNNLILKAFGTICIIVSVIGLSAVFETGPTLDLLEVLYSVGMCFVIMAIGGVALIWDTEVPEWMDKDNN